MSKVLQIRRGTGAQNDNFTGLAGEITFDTDAKTIRVHDGETLGGVALARADEIPTADTSFDIDSVPDTKWAEIVARVAPAPFYEYTSPAVTISGTAFAEYVFDNITTDPVIIRPILVCHTDAAGYAAGNETTAFGIGDYTRPMFYTYIDNNGLHMRLFIGGGAFWVDHISTGVRTNIANDEWRLKIRIYC